MEKRRFTRVPFHTLAKISCVAGVAEGEVINLSLNGLLIDAQSDLPPDTEVDIDIHLSGSSSELKFQMKGKTIRQTDDGLAVQFSMDGIDLESLTHLRYIVAYNSGDTDFVIKEYCDYLENNPKD